MLPCCHWLRWLLVQGVALPVNVARVRQVVLGMVPDTLQPTPQVFSSRVAQVAIADQCTPAAL